MKSILITILFSVTYLNTFGQRNFIEGIIIENNGNQKRGYIDYAEWVRSPIEISYKASLQAPAVVYSVNDIKGFSVQNVVYDALEFSFEKLSRNSSKPIFTNLTKYATRNKQMVTRKAFVRQLAVGKANLYEFVDKDLDEQFIIKIDNSIEVLTYHIIETSNKTAYIKEYQNQLNNLLTNSCTKLSISEADYSIKDLTAIINAYNNCFGTEKQKINKLPKGYFEYGLMAGVAYSTFTLTYPTTYNNVYIDGDSYIDPFGGLFLNYKFPRGKFSLGSELLTHRIKNIINYDNRTLNFDFRYLNWQNFIRYNIYSKESKIYLLAGLSTAFIIKDNFTIEERGKTTHHKNDINYSRFIRSDEQAILGGLGINIGKLIGEIRYRRGNGFGVSRSSYFPTNRIEGIIKYNFGRKQKTLIR